MKERPDFGKMIGGSDCMKAVFETIEKVSASDSTVLITGQSGTGKELVARAIHKNSDRGEQPFVPVNFIDVSQEILGNKLFGHETGASTGAIRTCEGLFDLAQSGTIFLDEIGDMSPWLQGKMLRVIQEREFERIGGIKTIRADVRIIAATNQNLEEAVAAKKFREDLFYRINVIPIHLPPLCRRGPDIEILANHFLTKLCALKNRQLSGFSSDAIGHFMKYPWPGNVRELENLIEMFVVMKEGGEIDVADLPPKFFSREGGAASASSPGSFVLPDEGVNFNDMVSEFEKSLLLQALEKTHGVKNRAAKLLNLNRTTLVEKLKRFNISDDSAPIGDE